MTGGGGSEIAVILLDESGCIVDAHASCAETFGWQREELLGKDVRDLLQYGRDLLMSQLHLLEEDESAGNTSFTVRVLAKRKDQQQFPARATIRRFQELQCWTVAFYRANSEGIDSEVPPSVSAEEIALAKRALEERAAAGSDTTRTRKAQVEAKKGDAMSVSRLWRNSRLLFSSHEDKVAESEALAALEAAQERKIADEAEVLVAECVKGLTPPVSQSMPPAPTPAVKAEKECFTNRSILPGGSRGQPEAVPQPRLEPVAPAVQTSSATHSVEMVATVAKLKAELEKERGERTRAEQRASSLSSQVQALHLQLSEGLNLERENHARVSALEQELRSAQELLGHARGDLDNERIELKACQDQLMIVRELNTRLEENVTVLEKGRQVAEASRMTLQAQVELGQTALKAAEEALDNEREARQRSEQALEIATREHRAQGEKLSADISALEIALANAEIAKSDAQKQELRVRADVLQAASDARAKTTRFRQNFSQVLQHINGTTRELLQSPLTEEQKYVIESLLQDVISLESTLEKETGSNAESGPALCAA